MKKSTIRKAKVKASGKEIHVYKLKEGTPTADHIWNRFLGDDISLPALDAGQHNETYKATELEFLD